MAVASATLVGLGAVFALGAFDSSQFGQGGTFTGNERWDAYATIVNRIRGWLMQLPDDARAAIAYKNAERFLAQLPR